MAGPLFEATSGELILTGTGTSVGVPVVGCDCEVCQSPHPRNKRMRSGVIVRAAEGTFLIDTGPELRLQLLRENVSVVHAAIYTHSHADHIFGLDDLRIFGHRLEQDIPLYCEEVVERQLRQSFNYAFIDPELAAHAFAIPRLQFERIGEDAFSVCGQIVKPIRLFHGNLPVLGFRFHDVAFCTDVSKIPPQSMAQLQGLEVLILDALREEPHPTHFSLKESLRVIRELKPKRAYLTHVSHDLEYEATNAKLPAGVELAWDGLRIPF